MKKSMPWIRCAGFLVGLAVILGICDFCFAPSGYVRFILHEVNRKDTQYDTIILGASHARSAINPEYLDVNVHPSKMELRFRKGESIYPWVEECINNALIEKPNIIDVELEKDVQTQYKDIILNAIKLIGIEKLRPLKDALPEQVTYFDIHYYIIKYNNNDI